MTELIGAYIGIIPQSIYFYHASFFFTLCPLAFIKTQNCETTHVFALKLSVKYADDAFMDYFWRSIWNYMIIE